MAEGNSPRGPTLKLVRAWIELGCLHGCQGRPVAFASPPSCIVASSRSLMHPGDAEENVIFILQLNSKSPLSALEQNPGEIEGSG